MIHLCSAARESTLQTARKRCWDAQSLRYWKELFQGGFLLEIYKLIHFLKFIFLT